ncbi:MAG TPA: protein arginine kinase [Syntrophomonas sp.]|jgi:protein arginine kinase|nr:protein arginine kinase [Syntrophomonas sp.]
MGIDSLLYSTHVGWMDSSAGPETDVAISSRVRLARNLDAVPFPHLLNEQTGKKVIDLVKQACSQSEYEPLRSLQGVTFDQLSELDRQILMEKHLISPQHAHFNDSYRGLLVNEDGSRSIMINEEDHLRIQGLLPGFDLEKCNDAVQMLDDELEKVLTYAFDGYRGYLTACPTNVGTGMRASVMLHLPGMAMTAQTNRIFHNIGQLGMTVRGLYGEGTEILGNFYQLSNQVTLGLSEEEICHNLTLVTRQIIEQERRVRDSLQKGMAYQLQDRIGRAYGLLSHAGIISSNEALTLLSDLRLGVDLGLITHIQATAINELIVAIRPAHLQKRAGQEMDAFQRDIKRAEVIKDILFRK